jgi:hypothetical protein
MMQHCTYNLQEYPNKAAGILAHAEAMLVGRNYQKQMHES